MNPSNNKFCLVVNSVVKPLNLFLQLVMVDGILGQLWKTSSKMFALWKCNHCSLSNYDKNTHCQACFENCTTLSPLRCIDHHRKLAFHGFLRMEIVGHLSGKDNQIPMDIVDLCYKFHQIDIDINNILSLNKESQIEHIYDLAKTCLKNKEFSFAAQLMNLIIHYDDEGSYRIVLAGIYNQWKWYDKAQSYYTKALEIAPDHKQPIFHYRFGLSLKSQKKFDEAIDEFKISLDLHEIGEYAYQIGYCYYRSHKYDDAERYLLKAIELDNDKVKYKYWYGILLRDTNKYREALPHFAKCSEMKPANFDHILQCAFCHERLHENDKAKELYLKAIEIANGKSARPYLWYGEFVKDVFRDYEEARSVFAKAWEIDPDNAGSYYHYAVTLRDDGKYEEAERYYLKALKIDPEGSGYNASYGYLSYLIGEYERAVKYIKIEMDLYDGDSFKWMFVYDALITNAMGDVRNAKIAFEKAIEMVTEKDKEDVLQHLEVMKNNDPKNDFYDTFRARIVGCKII